MGAIEKTVNSIVREVGPACQLVVICGRNKKLVEKLKSRSAKLSSCSHDPALAFDVNEQAFVPFKRVT